VNRPAGLALRLAARITIAAITASIVAVLVAGVVIARTAPDRAELQAAALDEAGIPDELLAIPGVRAIADDLTDRITDRVAADARPSIGAGVVAGAIAGTVAAVLAAVLLASGVVTDWSRIARNEASCGEPGGRAAE